MKSNNFIKIMLIIVSLLLLGNLIAGHISLKPEVALAQGAGNVIACSADGKYVYFVRSGRLFKSDDHGDEFHAISTTQFKAF
jgi:hypothetical protein